MKWTFLFAAVFALIAHAASAHDYKFGALEIAHPWARATPKGAPVAGGYLKITNKGQTADRLTGASSPSAAHVEIHEMKMTGGTMQMRPLPGGLEIKPGETVELKPGSYHIMFMNLKQPFEKGQRIKGTIVFEKAGPIEVEYTVEAVGAPAPGGHGH
jgi:periplasmic copper chaperone A